MKIIKGSEVSSSGVPDAAQLAAINEFTKKELAPEDVFTFNILLCDNDIDRDFERFSLNALNNLAVLFVGKTGIFDHNWSAEGQKARIFAAEVVSDPARQTAANETYAFLQASAYMLRTEKNSELIAEIEGGIKRETSVGCSVKPAVCSICGEEYGSLKCAHVKGRDYDGRLCWAEIVEATDAYEWSFVAVPAQRNAGVLKRFESQSPAFTGSEELYKLAALGESYLNKLRQEVVRLGMLSSCGFEHDALASAVSKMEENELLSFKKSFEQRIDELLPPVCQLPTNTYSKQDFNGTDFLV